MNDFSAHDLMVLQQSLVLNLKYGELTKNGIKEIRRLFDKIVDLRRIQCTNLKQLLS